MKIQIRIETLPIERRDRFGAVRSDVPGADVFANHRAVLRLH